jgi:hypothetical protein
MSVYSAMSEDRPHRAGQRSVAALADVPVYPDTMEPAKYVIGRAVEVGAPVAPVHPHTVNDYGPAVVLRLGGFQAHDHEPSTVLARAGGLTLPRTVHHPPSIGIASLG